MIFDENIAREEDIATAPPPGPSAEFSKNVLLINTTSDPSRPDTAPPFNCAVHL
jgi:hypothetical protein